MSGEINAQEKNAVREERASCWWGAGAAIEGSFLKSCLKPTGLGIRLT